MENEEIISKLSKEDKISLLTGKKSWRFHGLKDFNLNEIHMTDGPYGIREEIKNDSLFNKGKDSICYPASCLTACSFDKNLLFQLGENLAKEARHRGIQIILGPGINIKRSPLCGRNFEYISEDPYLAGKLASYYIQGVEKNNVGTSLKHFALNNQETIRFISNSVVDERALFEIYLKGFEIAIKEARPTTIMASYNKVNGIYSCENEYLLTKVLREKWNYKGLVISDWMAVNNFNESIKAGLNVEMPFTSKTNFKKAVKECKKNIEFEKIVDKRIDQTISTIKKLQTNIILDFDYNEYHKKAVQIASESMVLLKNNNFLPLNKNDNFVFIGDFALSPRFRGGGSSSVTPFKLINNIDDLKNRGIEVKFARGFDQNSLESDQNLVKEALNLAKSADKVVLFLGLSEKFESEGADRNSIDLPENQITLFNKIYEVNPNICVVLENGSIISLPFLEKSSAVLEAYLGGEGASEAINRILFGEVNPSGRLAETFIRSLDQCPNYKMAPTKNQNSLYKDSIFVGYRYYVSKNVPTLFDFGYGLSYSTFAYSNFSFDDSDFNKNGKFSLKISFDLKNESPISGKEVIQLYVSKPNNEIYQAKRELVYFDKVFLEGNSSKKIEITINEDSLKTYLTTKNDFVLLNGTYTFSINSDARNVIFEQKFSIENEIYSIGSENCLKNKYFDLDILGISDDEFISSFSLENKIAKVSKKYSMNSTLNEISKTFLGKIVANGIISNVEKRNDPMLIETIVDTPLRIICTFTGNVLDESLFKHLIWSLNKVFILSNIIIFGIKMIFRMKKL